MRHDDLTRAEDARSLGGLGAVKGDERSVEERGPSCAGKITAVSTGPTHAAICSTISNEALSPLT